MAETVRIDPASHAALTEIARAKHISLSEALARAVDAYRREQFLAAMTSGFEALHKDTKAWATELEERAPWATTDADGLEAE